MLRPRSALVALALVLALGAGLRAERALNPNEHTSNDEISYTKIATAVAFGEPYDALSTARGDGFHYPPGAPVSFALAHRVSGDHGPAAIYWTQWLYGVLLIGVVFVLAARLAGAWTGVVAAAAVAVYPPLVRGTGDVLSEPLGALLLALSALAVVWAWERRASWWAWAVPGALLGLTVLTRTDHLVLAFLAVAMLGAFVWAREGLRPGARAATVGLGAFLLVVVPWVVYASTALDRFVPVTTGGGSALYVGTFLPGDGTTFGLKREMQDEVRERYDKFRGTHWSKLPAAAALNLVAARHPDLDRDTAIQREGRHNLIRYVRDDPVAFAGMMASKAERMWVQPFTGGGRDNTGLEKTLHRLIAVLAIAGLLAGLITTRHPALAFVLLATASSTLLHTIVVSQPRYALPLMPMLIAAGAAGWVMARRARTAATATTRPPASAPAPTGP